MIRLIVWGECISLNCIIKKYKYLRRNILLFQLPDCLSHTHTHTQPLFTFTLRNVTEPDVFFGTFYFLIHWKCFSSFQDNLTKSNETARGARLSAFSWLGVRSTTVFLFVKDDEEDGMEVLLIELTDKTAVWAVPNKVKLFEGTFFFLFFFFLTWLNPRF